MSIFKGLLFTSVPLIGFCGYKLFKFDQEFKYITHNCLKGRSLTDKLNIVYMFYNGNIKLTEMLIDEHNKFFDMFVDDNIWDYRNNTPLICSTLIEDIKFLITPSHRYYNGGRKYLNNHMRDISRSDLKNGKLLSYDDKFNFRIGLCIDTYLKTKKVVDISTIIDSNDTGLFLNEITDVNKECEEVEKNINLCKRNLHFCEIGKIDNPDKNNKFIMEVEQSRVVMSEKLHNELNVYSYVKKYLEQVKKFTRERKNEEIVLLPCIKKEDYLLYHLIKFWYNPKI